MVSQLKGDWGCCLEGFGRVVVVAVVHIARKVVILKRARMVEKVCMRDGGIRGIWVEMGYVPSFIASKDLLYELY